MDSKNALIISEGYVPVERGKKGVDRIREFVLGEQVQIIVWCRINEAIL